MPPADHLWIKIFASDFKACLTNKDVEGVYQLSGGIERLVKFFVVNKNKIDLNLEKLLREPLKPFFTHFLILIEKK